MKRYALGLLVFSILIIVFGFMTEKITIASFQYISFPGVFMAVGKSLMVVLVLLLAGAAAVPSFLIDLALTFFTPYDFPMLTHLKNICWDGVAINWFWNETSGSSIFFGALVLFVISGFLSKSR